MTLKNIIEWIMNTNIFVVIGAGLGLIIGVIIAIILIWIMCIKIADFFGI